MNTLTQPSNLTELLDQYKEEPTPVLVQLSLNTQEEGYLVTEVIRKTLEACSGQVKFLKVIDPQATQISSELHLYRNPIYLIIFKGKLRAIHHGVIGSLKLITSIKRIITLSNKKAASSDFSR